MAWKKRSYLRADDDSSHSAATLRRLVDNLQDTNATRTKAAHCGFSLAEPLEVGTALPRPLPFWWPIEPEEAELTIRIVYEVDHAPIQVRWRQCEHDNRRDDLRTDWEELAVTSGRTVAEFTLDVSQRRRNTRWLPIPLEVWCKDFEVGTVQSVDLYPSSGPPYNVFWNFIDLDADLDGLGFSAYDCLTFDFYDAKGGSGGAGSLVTIDQAAVQSAVYTVSGHTRCYVWPRLAESGPLGSLDPFSDVESVDVKRHGTLKLYAVEVVGVEGTPYLEDVDGQVFPLRGGPSDRAGLAPDIPLRASPHRLPYQAGEYLWTRRRPIWGWGPNPRETIEIANAIFKYRCWHHITWSNATTGLFDWHTIAEIPLDGGDLFDIEGTVYERQRLDVTLALIPLVNSAEAPALPIELRTRTLGMGGGGLGAVDFTGAPVGQVFEEYAPPSQMAWLWPIYTNLKRQRAIPNQRNNLQGFFVWEDWGKNGMLLVTLPHDDDTVTGQRVLQVQVKLAEGVDLLNTDAFYWTLMVPFVCVQERGGVAWGQLGVASSGASATSSSIRLPDHFQAIKAHGAATVAQARRLGAGGEWARTVDNDHHLRSQLARRIFTAAWWNDPITSTAVSPDYDDVREVIFEFAAGRNQLLIEAAIEDADLRIELYDDTGMTSVDAATLSYGAGGVSLVSYGPTVGSLYSTILIRIRLRRNTGATARLYLLTLRERPIPVTLL